MYIRVVNKRGMISDLVDTIFIDVALSPNSSLPVKSYTGDFDNANIELGFRITCSENYHGNNCTAYCTPGGAQYHCTAEGMTCNAGYKNPSTNCTECVPAHGCCKWVRISPTLPHPPPRPPHSTHPQSSFDPSPPPPPPPSNPKCIHLKGVC